METSARTCREKVEFIGMSTAHSEGNTQRAYFNVGLGRCLGSVLLRIQSVDFDANLPSFIVLAVWVRVYVAM